MRLSLLLLFISLNAFGQAKITFNDGHELAIKPQFIIADSLYFSTDKQSVYKIPLADLSAYPDGIKKLEPVAAEWYLMKFRRDQLTGIGLIIAGAISTTVVAITTGEDAAVYIGAGLITAGFAFSLKSFSGIKKYYITESAIPYKR